MRSPQPVDNERLLAVLRAAAEGARAAVADVVRAGAAAYPGRVPGQYATDAAADEAALSVLLPAGLGVLSEESGPHHPDRKLTAVLDPLDGSRNCAHGLPWYGTSVCVLDDSGIRAAVVVNIATGAVYEAVAGGGAKRDGRTIAVGNALTDPLVITTAPIPADSRFTPRTLGAAALDLCLVAEGAADGFVDSHGNELATWDYLGATLIVREAGGAVADREARPLEVLDTGARRTIVAGSNAVAVDALSNLAPDLRGSAAESARVG